MNEIKRRVASAGAHYFVNPFVRLIAGRIPGAEFKTIATAGHYPYLEQPDAFVEAVTQFIKRH